MVLSFNVSQDTTTAVVTASPITSDYGQSVTFQATVAVSSPGAGRPTGTVTFMDGTTTLGTGTLSTSGGVTTATFTTSTLALGSHSITAAYSGDTDDIISTSPVLNFNVAQDPTTAVVTASPTATVYGQSVTFKTSVAITDAGSGPPTGTVTFMDGTTTLGTVPLSTSSGATSATFTTTALAVGSHSITAIYSGDTDDLPTTSAVLTFKVAQDTTTTTLTASPASPALDQSVKLTATIGITGPGAGVPTGTVSFYNGSTLLGTSIVATTNGVSTATFTIPYLAVGVFPITAQYSGDTNDLTSTSAALALTMSRVHRSGRHDTRKLDQYVWHIRLRRHQQR